MITVTRDLTFAQLRLANIERNKTLDPRGLNGWSLAEWMCALTGELGEAADVIKKLLRERDGVMGNTKTAHDYMGDLRKELADVQIYLDLLAAAAGIDLSQATIDKFNEVSVRLGLNDRITSVVEAPDPAARLAPGDRRSKVHPYRCYNHDRRDRPSDLLGEKHYHGRIKDKKLHGHRRHGDPPPTDRTVKPLTDERMRELVVHMDELVCPLCVPDSGIASADEWQKLLDVPSPSLTQPEIDALLGFEDTSEDVFNATYGPHHGIE